MANPIPAHSAVFTASIPFASNREAAHLEGLLNNPSPSFKQKTNDNLQHCLQVSHTDSTALAAAIEDLLVDAASSMDEAFAPASGFFKRFHLPTFTPARCTRQRQFYVYHDYAGGTANLLVNPYARPGDRIRAYAGDSGWESRALARKLSLPSFEEPTLAACAASSHSLFDKHAFSLGVLAETFLDRVDGHGSDCPESALRRCYRMLLTPEEADERTVREFKALFAPAQRRQLLALTPQSSRPREKRNLR